MTTFQSEKPEFKPGKHTGRLRGKPTMRGRITGAFKTLSWVVPLTVLTWVYAEKARDVVSLPATIQIQIETDVPDRVALLGNEQRSVRVEVAGPQANVQQFSQAAEQTGNNPVVLRVPESELEKSNTLFLLPRLQNLEIFRDNAVTLKSESVYPESVKVTLANLTSDRMPVKVLPEDEASLGARISSSSTEQKPIEVMVRHPTSQPFDIVADLSSFRERTGHFEAEIPLRIIGSTEQVKCPPSIDGWVDIGELKTMELTDVRIFVLGEARTLANATVSPDIPSTSFKVIGPPQQIEKLKSKTFPYHVVLRIDPQDAVKENAGKQLAKTLEPSDFYLPPGVQPVANEKVEIPYKIFLTAQP